MASIRFNHSFPMLSPVQAALILNALSGIGAVACRKFSDAFDDSLPAIFRASRKQLASIRGVGDTLADKILNWENDFDLAREEAKMEQFGFEFIPFFDERYPATLKEIPDAPIGIYVYGNSAALQTRRALAIVGTRKATPYGASMAHTIAGELAAARWNVISGLARGIDTAAHKGCLDGNGTTVAVLGCGLDIVYPPENLELYRQIAASGGAVISEFRLGRSADKRSFPKRNRIIAGLSAAMLVVESDEKGGSMLSAGFAADYGRTVFALPGRVDQINSRGCHKLIREGATLITGAKDIIDEMESVASQPSLALEFGEIPVSAPAEKNRPRPELSGDAATVFATLASGDALSPDAIAEHTGLPAATVLSKLLLLELDALVVRKTDGTYERKI